MGHSGINKFKAGLPKKQTRKQLNVKEEKIRLSFESNLLTQFLYIVLRIFHIGVLACVAPITLIWFNNYADATGIEIPVWSAYVSIGAIFFWGLLYVGLESFGYPIRLGGAIIYLGLLTTNFISGMNLTEWDIPFGAFTLTLSSLTAQTIFFLSFILGAAFPFVRKLGWPEVKLPYVIFLICAVAILGYMDFFLWKAFFNILSEETSVGWFWVLIGGMGIDIIFSFLTLYGASVVNGAAWSQPEARWQLWGAWMLIILIGILGTVMAYITVLSTYG